MSEEAAVDVKMSTESNTEAKVESKVESVEPVQSEPADMTVAKLGHEKKEPANGAEDKLSDLEIKIVRQIEFYYGDINLPRDKFLQEQVKLDDGWVPLETMLKFNRLQTLTKEQSVIAAAIRKSTSGLMEVSEDGTKIRRTPSKPVPNFTPERMDAVKWRSVYAKGFSLDAGLDELMTFFETFGRTELVSMRKNPKKDFKGSCFVVYQTDEDAKKFVEAPDVKYRDVAILREFRHDYFKRKNTERKQRDDDKVKAKQQFQQKQEDEFRSQIVKGSVMKVEKLPAVCSVDELRQHFGKFGDVKWVDWDKELAQARVRFAAEDEAKSALTKAKEAGDEGKITFKDSELICSVLEGDDEAEHWRGIYQSKKERKDRSHGGGRGGHSSSRGKRKFGSGKRGGRGGHRDRPQAKKAKTDDDDGDDDEAGGADSDHEGAASD